MCFMMIRGRHRGLPYALDRAIMLPSDTVNETGIQSEKKDDSNVETTKDKSRKLLPMRAYLTT